MIAFELKNGIEVGGVCHNLVELKRPTAGDILRCRERGEVLRLAPDGTPVMVGSPTATERAYVETMVLKIGDLPFAAAFVNQLSAGDYRKIVSEIESTISAEIGAGVREGSKSGE